MLLRYAREHHFPNPTFFVDDGVSGVTYDRPGFQAMLAEIEAERVAVCITKDLSRLGRNSALTGLYTNFTFPQYGVRYEDKVLGRIPESVCVNLLNQYEAERREKQERHKELTGQLAASRETESSVDAWLDMMQDYAQLEELDRPTLVRLIQKIEISERYPVDDHEERDIHIYYNFVGYIEA